MPSTYSSSLRLELQASGENANTWGTKTNNNLNLIEQAIAGYSKITLASASATYTLPIADASASEGRNAFIEFAGTVASAISVIVPEVEKGYWVRNSATGSTLTVRTSAGTGVTLPTNEWVFLISDGVSVYSTLPTSLTNYARLDTSQTFTGANTFTSAVTVSGPATFASLVDIKGSTSLASTLFVAGTASFAAAVSVSGDLWVKNNLLVTSIVDIGGRLQVTGESRLNNVSAAGTLNVTQTFLVSGAATLASSVDIKGPTSLASTLIVAGTATFNSNVSVNAVLRVTSSANFASGHFTGGVRMASDLSVTGTATFGRLVYVTSAILCSATIGVIDFTGNNSAFKCQKDIVIGVARTTAADVGLYLYAQGSGGPQGALIMYAGGSAALLNSGGPVRIDGGLVVTYPDNETIILNNLLIGTCTAPVGAFGTLVIGNNAPPTSSVLNSVILYAEDVASSSELKVRDEAGNVTTLSPHNFSGCGGPSEEMAWSYYSERNGKFVNIDMMKLARLLEKLTGEKLVYIGNTP